MFLRRPFLSSTKATCSFATFNRSFSISMNRITNPFTGEVVEETPHFTEVEAKECLNKAQQGFQSWRKLPLDVRIEHIKKGIAVFSNNKNAIASDITAATGKPLASSLGETVSGIAKMKRLCELAVPALAKEERKGAGVTYEIHRVPKGVIDIMAPWNYPVFTAQNGVLPALLSGNAVVLRQEECPAVARWFERAFGGNQVPVFHMNTSVETHNSLAVSSEIVKHRVFTGSVKGGRVISGSVGARAQNEELSSPFINVSLELGGCDSAYLHKDADLKNAINFIVKVGRLHNAGQSCCAVKRVFVHPSVYDDFLVQASAVNKSQVLGDPLNPKTTMGPMFGGEKACMELFDMVLDAKSKGAQVIVDGEDETNAPDLEQKIVKQIDNGWFFTPTMIAGASFEMKVMREESFGPLLPVQKASEDTSTLLNQVNSTKYGLTTSVWTQDADLVDAFVHDSDVGTVMVNWCNDVHADLVWSGVKQAGNGIGAMGLDGFRALTFPKSVLKSPEAIAV